MLSLTDIRNDAEITQLIGSANHVLKQIGYTDHGPRHTGYVSRVTADILKGFLMSALQNGTGNGAFVEGISAGGKTGTAQTGWKTEDRSILNGWFCGFFEGKDTEYVIVVLKEDVKSGSYDCAPIFREITLKMHSLGY